MHGGNYFTPPAVFVKLHSAIAGLPLGRVAREAGISQPALTLTLAGRRRGADTQRRIWRAVRRLFGLRIGYRQFWGEFLEPRRRTAA